MTNKYFSFSKKMLRGTLLLQLLLLILNSNIVAQNISVKDNRNLKQLPANQIAKLDSLFKASNYPGLSISIVTDDGVYNYIAGYSDSARHEVLTSDHLFLSGSVGKTYCAALLLKLVEQGKLDPNAKVAKYLGQNSWFVKLPNANDVTVRMLMNHTSGIMRYEFKPQFTADLTANRDKIWKPVELLSYIFNEKPAFEAGKGWDYSDTNYILLAMIIESITGKKYYTLVKEWLLKPLGLTQTFPSDKRKLKGLAQGYAGMQNDFGGKNEMVDKDGKFIINPQFEWSGGGIYQSTADLALWMKMLQEGAVVTNESVNEMRNGVPAKLGPRSMYGIGLIIKELPGGNKLYGHSGFFPGYLTECFYVPESKAAIAVHVNTSDFKNIKLSPARLLNEVASMLAAGNEFNFQLN